MSNKVDGEVVGNVVQAQVVHGDVNVHGVPPVVAFPHRFGPVLSRADAFQNRSVTGILAAALGYDAGKATFVESAGHVGVLSGLGGVGKTQLAADFSQLVWEAGAVDMLAWVTATSREAVIGDFARLAAELTGIDEPDPVVGATRFVEWLATAPVRWLVVLDDLGTPAFLDGLWPPRAHSGRVVVTTRRRDAALRGPGRCLVDVGLFTDQEAGGYLRSKLGADLAVGAAELGRVLGHLPLALSQAAAYQLDRGLTCADYLVRWSDRRRTLGSLLPEPDAVPDQYRHTLAVTWSMSVEHANRLVPEGLAGPVLEVLAVLDPNGVPERLLTEPAILGLLRSTSGRPVEDEDVRDALMGLARLSLLRYDSSSAHTEIRVHALVQRAVRDQHADRVATVARIVADALVSSWPEIERDAELSRALRANTAAVHDCSPEGLWSPSLHAVVIRAGDSLGRSGQVDAAHDYYEGLRRASSRHLAPEHPDALVVRHESAHWQGETGEVRAAVLAFEELLADRLRLLGPHHPHTLATRVNLAHWVGKAGDAHAAVAMLEDLLPDRLRIEGPDHPATMVTRRNLAFWRGRTGDLGGAVAELRALLADCVRVKGADHYFTLSTQRSLTHALGELTGSSERTTTMEQLLSHHLRVLGPDHPHTLTVRRNLAQWLGEAGNPAGAVAHLTTLLSDHQRIMGPRHPNTIFTRDQLARWRSVCSD
ncbi:tetratricopeptide repeat protein [Actinosynnema sp. NPDC050436]|uniref:tetratricopeptide repeat protein n=1 Tax=Actinosynnema sp. NPDC050436 TaxID=3155659 RepID=UPI0033C93355